MKDLQFALRRIRRDPLFLLSVTLILGLGIAANATTLSIVNAFMWRPVSVPNPDQLVLIASRNNEAASRLMPLPLIEVLGRSDISIEALCGYNGGLAATDAAGQSAPTSLMFVTGDCFSTLQVQPLLGRLIGPEDAPLHGKGRNVVVLGYSYWQRTFGGAADVIGKSIRIDTSVATIVGVLPQHFTGLNRDLDAALVVPFNSYTTNTGAAYLVGRLQAHTGLAQAESRLRTVWASALEEALPPTLAGDERRRAVETTPELVSARTGHSTLRRLYGTTFMNIAALTGLLALLTSINVGGLPRLASKLTEVAIFRSLGATRWRVTRTMLMEALLLALGGCAVGLPLAYVAAPAFVMLLPTGNLPWTISLQPDGRVVASAVGIAVLMAITITALPAWLATRRRSLTLGTDRTVARATNRSAQVLLVVQVAATLVLVFGCSLLVRSVVALERVDRGYASGNVLSIRLTSTPGGYTALDQTTSYRELVARVGALPGVISTGMARYFGTLPNESAWYRNVTWAGEEEAITTAIFEYAAPGFFQTVGIPLLRGRDFTWSDGSGSAAVVLVSESLARVLDPEADVVGRFLRFGSEPARQKLQIIGLVGNTSFGNSRAADIRAVYFPGIQAGQATYGTLHIRTNADLTVLAHSLREILAGFGREQILAMSTIDGLFENWLVEERMGAIVSSAVTLLALCIACTGVYALLTYAVARRTREMGIRMAVGARARDVSTLVVRDAVLIAGLGVCLDIPAALMAAKLLEALVFGVTTDDLTMLLASAAVLIGIAVAAAVVPAWRAVRVDPMIALRAD